VQRQQVLLVEQQAYLDGVRLAAVRYKNRSTSYRQFLVTA
jgi:hypothetical protein